VSLTAITVCVASQRVFIVVSVYFVIDSVRKLMDIPSQKIAVKRTFNIVKGHLHRSCFQGHNCVVAPRTSICCEHSYTKTGERAEVSMMCGIHT
jgi:hypothetical protein